MAGITAFRPMPLRRSSVTRASKRKSIIGAMWRRARCWVGPRARSPPSAIAILRSPPRRALAIRRSAFRCRRTGRRSKISLRAKRVVALPAIAQFLAVRQDRRHELSAARAVLERMDGDGDLVARFDRIWLPADARLLRG